MITQEMLEDLFKNTRKLKAEGRIDWDIDHECRWSFFFVDTSRDKLVAAGRHLEAGGYESVGLLEPSPEDDDQTMLYLRADRVETHTVESLLQRNEELYSLADSFGLGGYDGMDAGAAEGP